MKKTYIQPCAILLNGLATTILAGSDFKLDDTAHTNSDDFGAKESAWDADDED